MLNLAGKPLDNFSQGGRFFFRSWNTIFPAWVGGVVHHQTHGNAHQVPPTRSTPKPHVPKLMWGVLPLFLMSASRVLAVFVLNSRFHCLFWVTEKARFRPVCGIDQKNTPGNFPRPVAHIGGFYGPKSNFHYQESP